MAFIGIVFLIYSAATDRPPPPPDDPTSFALGWFTYWKFYSVRVSPVPILNLRFCFPCLGMCSDVAFGVFSSSPSFLPFLPSLE